MKVPHDYVVIQEEDSFELRKYRDMLLAKVMMDGPFENAHKHGGKILKEYLDGQNLKREKLLSLAPLMLRARPEGWEVSCILPSHLTLDAVPMPVSEKIKFEEVKPRPVAVVKFHGKSHYTKMMKKTEELKFWAKRTELRFTNTSKIVLLRSPIFPFLRKNEIHLEGCPP